jgi:hypothetical protein
VGPVVADVANMSEVGDVVRAHLRTSQHYHICCSYSLVVYMHPALRKADVWEPLR